MDTDTISELLEDCCSPICWLGKDRNFLLSVLITSALSVLLTLQFIMLRKLERSVVSNCELFGLNKLFRAGGLWSSLLSDTVKKKEKCYVSIVTKNCRIVELLCYQTSQISPFNSVSSAIHLYTWSGSKSNKKISLFSCNDLFIQYLTNHAIQMESSPKYWVSQ